MITLRGMTWNHVRGYGPLLATTEQFGTLYPDIEIKWDRRSLKDFGDFSVEALARSYDIIMIDHPHVDIASRQGVLTPLDDWIPAVYLNEQRMNSIGQSYQSYEWNGHQWALPVDAAAQVAAYRPDLLDSAMVPRTWEQVYALTERLSNTQKIGWPLCPTDTMCSFLSLCANIGSHRFFDEETGISTSVGEAALKIMLNLLPKLHESSLFSNPIQMYDLMVSTDSIVYLPLAFGYSNYSRLGFAERQLRFTNIPSTTNVPEGSLLGGAGMAISALSKHIPIAVQFAMFTASPDIQRSVYVEGGGQPGHASVWRDQAVNHNTNGFFEQTLQTLERSYMRPRNKLFPAFQEQGGELLHAALRQFKKKEKISVSDTVVSLNRLYTERV